MFFDKLKKLLEGGVAQVNPFDGGKTFSTVMQNRQPAPRPQQKPNIIQDMARTAQQGVQNPVRSLNNITRPVTGVSVSEITKQIPTAFGQVGQELNKVSSMAPMGVRDVFDANTQADQQKRVAEGRKADYFASERDLGNNRPYQNVAAMLAGGTARFANTGVAAINEAVDTARVAMAPQDMKAAYMQVLDENQKARFAQDSGLLGQGTWFNSQQDYQKTAADPLALLRRAGTSVAETALERASFGMGGARNKLVEQGAKQFIKTGAKKAGVRAVEGAISDAAGQQFQRDTYSPMQTVYSAAGAVGIPLAASGAGKVLRTGTDKLGQVAEPLTRKGRELLERGARSTQEFVSGIPTRTRPGFIANPFYRDGSMRSGITKDQIFDGVDGKPRVEFDDSMSRIKDPNGKTLGEVLDHPILYEQYPGMDQTPIRGLKYNRGEAASMDLSTGVLSIDPAKIDRSNLMHEVQHKIQGLEGFTLGTNPKAAADAKRAKILETLEPLAEEYNARARAWKAKEAEVAARFGTKSPEYAAVSREGVELTKSSLYKRVVKLNKENNKLAKNGDYEGYFNNAGEAESRIVEKRLDLSPEQRAQMPVYDSLDVPKDKLIYKNSDANNMGRIKLPGMGEVDPLEALKAEARKYKSAEEFVKAQGDPLYHGSNTSNIDMIEKNFRTLSEAEHNKFPTTVVGGYQPGLSTTSDKTMAEYFASLQPYGKDGVVQLHPVKQLRVYELPKNVDSIDQLGSKKVLELKAEGYDVIHDVRNTGGEAETRILNPEAFKTKQQLTDLYNQATKGNPLDALKAERDALAKQIKGANGTPEQYARYRELRDAIKLGENPPRPVANPGKLDNLNPTGGVYVDYTPEKRATMPLADNIKTLAHTTKQSPDTMITIYRGAPKSQKSIVPGDFIITDTPGMSGFEAAKYYSGDGNVISKKVRLGDILDDVNDPQGGEYLYRPGAYKEVSKATKPDNFMSRATGGVLGKNRGGYIDPGAIKRDLQGQFATKRNAGKVNMHPDDQRLLLDFREYAADPSRYNDEGAATLETAVERIAQKYQIPGYGGDSNKFLANIEDTLNNRVTERYVPPPQKEPGPVLSPRGIDEQTGMGKKLFNQSDFEPKPQMDDKAIVNLAKASRTEDQFVSDMRGRSGKTPQELAQIFQNTQKKGGFGDFLGGLMDKKRGGYVALPQSSNIPDNFKMPKTEGDKAIRSMIDEAADALSDFKKQVGGVTRVPGADGAQVRESTNPKWYQDFYAANGRPPTKGEIRDIAYDMLERGDRELEGIGIDTELYKATKEMATQVPKAPAPEAANALEPAPEVNTKQSGFARSVSKSDEISPELQAKVREAAPEYTPVTNQAQIEASEALIRKGYKKAATEVNERLNVKEGTIDNQTTSDAIAAIKALDAKGGPANLQLATDLTEKLAAHLTKAGQTVQAASILNNRTPQGMLYAARKTLKKAGVEITPEIQASLDAAVKKVKATTGEEKQYAIAELTKTVNELIPSSFKDKAVTLWKAGLLTGIKTQTGNTLSGGASFVMKKASDPLAAGIDKLISLGTGKRTKTLTFKGVGSGGAEGVDKGIKSLVTGIDERNIEANKFDLKQVNFGKGPLGRAADKYTKTIFGIMGAADRPLYYATLRNNLQDIAKAEAINNGLKGGKRAAFISDFVKNPPTDKFQIATDAAEKAIFGNDTVLSKAAAGVRQAVADKPVASAAVDVILPFTKVPSAVVSRIVDYSPAGAVKTAVLAIRNAKKTGVLDQRALSEGLAEAGVGTGVIAIGLALREAGLLTGSYPKDDKERELWKLEGKQENSVKVGGTWLSLNYTSPLGQLLGVGGKIADAKKEGASTPEALAVGAAGGASTVLDQSFLQGVQGALDTVSNPVEELPKFANRQAGSIIPTIVGDTARATDPLQREADNPLEAILARTPGASQNLNPKRDAFGDPLARQSNPVSTMIDPFRPSDIRPSTPLNTELRRLQDAGEGIIPLRDSSYLGDDKKLSKSELNQIGSEVGPKIKASWEKVIADPRYAKLSDADKNIALKKAMTDINAAYKVMNSGSEEEYKKLTTDQKRVYSGKDTSAFKDEPATAKERYESKLETYKEDKEAGKISEIEDIKRKRELKGLEVRKDYSEDAIDLHTMSKKDVYNYISQSQNGKKLAEELLKLDDALTAAGVQDKNKFRDKYGNPTLQPKEKGSGKGKKAKMPTDYAKTRKAISSKIRSKSTQVTYKGTGKGSGVAIRKTLKKAKI